MGLLQAQVQFYWCRSDTLHRQIRRRVNEAWLVPEHQGDATWQANGRTEPYRNYFDIRRFMELTTTPSMEGKRITCYCGVVAGEAILGANIFRDTRSAYSLAAMSVGASMNLRYSPEHMMFHDVSSFGRR